MDLNRLFSKDGGHTTQPYLPLEPEIAITTGQYASEVDVLLGLSFFFSFSWFVQYFLFFSIWQFVKDRWQTRL